MNPGAEFVQLRAELGLLLLHDGEEVLSALDVVEEDDVLSRQLLEKLDLFRQELRVLPVAGANSMEGVLGTVVFVAAAAATHDAAARAVLKVEWVSVLLERETAALEGVVLLAVEGAAKVDVVNGALALGEHREGLALESLLLVQELDGVTDLRLWDG